LWLELWFLAYVPWTQVGPHLNFAFVWARRQWRYCKSLHSCTKLPCRYASNTMPLPTPPILNNPLRQWIIIFGARHRTSNWRRCSVCSRVINASTLYDFPY